MSGSEEEPSARSPSFSERVGVVAPRRELLFRLRRSPRRSAFASRADSQTCQISWRSTDRMVVCTLVQEGWQMPKDDLAELIALARGIDMTPQEKERQRRSFAYGNTKVENRDITQDAIAAAADVVAAEGDLE